MWGDIQALHLRRLCQPASLSALRTCLRRRWTWKRPDALTQENEPNWDTKRRSRRHLQHHDGTVVLTTARDQYNVCQLPNAMSD